MLGDDEVTRTFDKIRVPMYGGDPTVTTARFIFSTINVPNSLIVLENIANVLFLFVINRWVNAILKIR